MSLFLGYARPEGLSEVNIIYKGIMHTLKPLAAALFIALAPTAYAATVTIAGGGVEITTDPNASPALNFTSYVGAAISTPVITGDVTGSGEMHLNGTVTFNGNIGTAGTRMGYLSTGSDWGAARQGCRTGMSILSTATSTR